MDEFQAQNTEIRTDTTQQPKRSYGRVVALLASFIAIFAAAAGVYVWQQQKVARLEAELSVQKTVSSVLSKQVESLKTVPLSSDEKVINAVKAYCSAIVEPKTKQPFVLTMGTSYGKQVIYSSDMQFANVNAACGPKGGTTQGGGMAYYLKNVNDTWIVLYRGQEPNSMYTTMFNIPPDSDFK